MYSNPPMDYPYHTPSFPYYSTIDTTPTTPSFPSFPSFPWELFTPYYTHGSSSPKFYLNHGYSPHPSYPNPYSLSHYSDPYNNYHQLLQPTKTSYKRDFGKHLQVSHPSFKKKSQTKTSTKHYPTESPKLIEPTPTPTPSSLSPNSVPDWPLYNTNREVKPRLWQQGDTVDEQSSTMGGEIYDFPQHSFSPVIGDLSFAVPEEDDNESSFRSSSSDLNPTHDNVIIPTKEIAASSFVLDDDAGSSSPIVTQTVVPILTPSYIDSKLLVDNVDVVKSGFKASLLQPSSLVSPKRVSSSSTLLPPPPPKTLESPSLKPSSIDFSFSPWPKTPLKPPDILSYLSPPSEPPWDKTTAVESSPSSAIVKYTMQEILCLHGHHNFSQLENQGLHLIIFRESIGHTIQYGFEEKTGGEVTITWEDVLIQNLEREKEVRLPYPYAIILSLIKGLKLNVLEASKSSWLSFSVFPHNGLTKVSFFSNFIHQKVFNELLSIVLINRYKDLSLVKKTIILPNGHGELKHRYWKILNHIHHSRLLDNHVILASYCSIFGLVFPTSCEDSVDLHIARVNTNDNMQQGRLVYLFLEWPSQEDDISQFLSIYAHRGWKQLIYLWRSSFSHDSVISLPNYIKLLLDSEFDTNNFFVIHESLVCLGEEERYTKTHSYYRSRKLRKLGTNELVVFILWNLNCCHDHTWDYVFTMHPIRFLLPNYKKQVDVGKSFNIVILCGKFVVGNECVALIIPSCTELFHVSLWNYGLHTIHNVFEYMDHDTFNMLKSVNQVSIYVTVRVHIYESQPHAPFIAVYNFFSLCRAWKKSCQILHQSATGYISCLFSFIDYPCCCQNLETYKTLVVCWKFVQVSKSFWFKQWDPGKLLQQ